MSYYYPALDTSTHNYRYRYEHVLRTGPLTT